MTHETQDFIRKHSAIHNALDKYHFFLDGIISNVNEAAVEIRNEQGEMAAYAFLIDQAANTNNAGELVILGLRQDEHSVNYLRSVIEAATQKLRAKRKSRVLEIFDEGTIPQLNEELKTLGFGVNYKMMQLETQKEIILPLAPLPQGFYWIDYHDDLAKSYHQHITTAFEGIRGVFILPLEQHRERIKKQIGKESIRLLMNEDNEIAGSCKFGPSLDSSQLGEIKNIARGPKYKGHSLGIILMNESIEKLRQLGFHLYSLEVNATNEKALKLYQTFGFTEKKTLTAYNFIL